MLFMRTVALLALAQGALTLGSSFSPANRTFYNPGLPGSHSDPSCAFVPEFDSTTFCVTSSFPTFPGLPLYASRDLDTWYHVSNVFNRPEQVPVHASLNYNADEGFWAPTVRYHDGFLYVVATYMHYDYTIKKRVFPILLFKTDDPFDSSKWSMPIEIENPRGTIDPDLFWGDNNGTVYLASGWGSIYLAEVNLETGSSTTPLEIWAGSGGSNPEGPHIFKKDGYFYLLVAEGGIGPNHSATIARSRESIYGPYESYAGNPILTNRGTDEFFQTVGHADFFQDSRSEWWAAALATRRALDSLKVPMGRETVFTPVTWEGVEWPILDPIRGKMTGWPQALGLSRPDKLGDFAAKYPAVDGADDIDSFLADSSLPIHFVHHRSKGENAYVPSPPERPGWLKLIPSISNVTRPSSSPLNSSSTQEITFLARRQTASLFSFSVDLAFDPQIGSEEEAGITIFLTQHQHIDLGIIFQGTGEKNTRALRLRPTSSGQPDVPELEPVIREIPRSWAPAAPIRLSFVAEEDGSYVFSATSSPGGKPQRSIVLDRVSSGIVSGDEGRFVGTLIGVYATTNGVGVKTRSPTPAYVRHWKYTPIAQEISEGEYLYI